MQTTGRGVSVVGVTSRVDTPLLLEKRVKSRFSQRIYRVVSPLAGADIDEWTRLLRNALLPWYGPRGGMDEDTGEGEDHSAIGVGDNTDWMGDWEMQVNEALEVGEIEKHLQRICELTTDVRLLFRPFIDPIRQILSSASLTLDSDLLLRKIQEQTQASGWGSKLEKLRGLSHPCLVILIISKHFSYAGKEEFNLAMAEHEYVRFAKSSLSGSGRARWSPDVLRVAWDHLLATGLLMLATRFKPSTNQHMQRFILCRSALSRNEILNYFRGEGSKLLGSELTNWGRMAGGHA